MNVPSLLGSAFSFSWYSKAIGAGDQRKALNPGRPAIADTSCSAVFTWDRSCQLIQSANLLSKGEMTIYAIKKLCDRPLPLVYRQNYPSLERKALQILSTSHEPQELSGFILV